MKMIRSVTMREARPKYVDGKPTGDFDYCERALVIDLGKVDAWFSEGFGVVLFCGGQRFTVVTSSLPAEFLQQFGP